MTSLVGALIVASDELTEFLRVDRLEERIFMRVGLEF